MDSPRRAPHAEIDDSSLLRVAGALGAAGSPAWEQAAELLRAEQPHLLRSAIAALAPLGRAPLHFALQWLVLGWLALALRRGARSRCVGRANYRKRVQEWGSWMDRLAAVDERLLERWLRHGAELPHPGLLEALVHAIFEDPRCAGLSDGARGRILLVLLSCVEALRCAGRRRADTTGAAPARSPSID